jgi:hypothetical protein
MDTQTINEKSAAAEKMNRLILIVSQLTTASLKMHIVY